MLHVTVGTLSRGGGEDPHVLLVRDVDLHELRQRPDHVHYVVLILELDRAAAKVTDLLQQRVELLLLGPDHGEGRVGREARRGERLGDHAVDHLAGGAGVLVLVTW